MTRDVHERRLATDSLGRQRLCLSLAQRLWRHVDKSGGPDACWPYTGARSSAGYGSLGGTSGGGAHRVAYEAANGPIPGGLSVCHRCDNPPCCNPAHLFLGTALDNAQDMVSKGRSADMRNERSGMAKLTNAQVSELRCRAAAGEALSALAAEFGIDSGHLSRVVRALRRPIESSIDGEVVAAVRTVRTERTIGHRAARARQYAEAKRLYEGGMSTNEVGAAVGLDASTVSRALRAAGVQMRPRSSRLFYLPAIDRETVRRLYTEGVRVKAIARQLGVGPRRITRVLDESGLPRFGPGNPAVVTARIHQEPRGRTA